MNKFFLKFAPFTVTVYWGRDVFTHKAWSLKGALEWVRCYPLGADLVARKRGSLVLYRGMSL
jgi:hypothetical protein